MSKAFLRESDAPELPRPSPPPLLPFGAKNYLTPAGARRLGEELARLVETERPTLVSKGTDSETKALLQELDQRIRYLEHSLRTAEVTERPDEAIDEVRFGASVTVRDQSGEVSTYRIVGVDEIEPERGQISWLSPMARALLTAKAGQQVKFKSPAGEQQLEVLRVAYE